MLYPMSYTMVRLAPLSSEPVHGTRSRNPIEETLRAAGQDDEIAEIKSIDQKQKAPSGKSPKGLVRARFVMNLQSHDTSGAAIERARTRAIRGAQTLGALNVFGHD